MVIIHLSDKQRRIISPEKNETLEAVFKRFCYEFGYQESEYKFQSFPPDPLVLLDMNMSAIRVKEVALVQKGDSRRGSSDSCYTTIHDLSPEVTQKLNKVVPPARPPPIGLKSKPAKRSAPKPPDLSLNPIRRESSSSPDIEIPLPPPFHPDDSQPSIFVSIECETESIPLPEVIISDSTISKSNSNSLRNTPYSRGHGSCASNSIDSINVSDDDDKHHSEPVLVKNLKNKELWRESRASQGSLHSLDMNSDYEPIESESIRKECTNSVNLDVENTSELDPVPLLDPSLKNLSPATVIEEIDVIQFQLSQRYSISEQGLKISRETAENYSETGSKERKNDSNLNEINGDIKREGTVTGTTNPIEKRLSLTGGDPVAHSQFGDNFHVNSIDSKLTKSSKPKVETSEACTSYDLLESSDEDDNKVHVTTREDKKIVASGNPPVVSVPVPAARLSLLHYWDTPKQSKTIQFLSQSMNSNDHLENTKPTSGDDKARESLLVTSAISTPQVTKPVKVIVQEEPEEQSDRPTYRPKQAKRLYFTAE